MFAPHVELLCVIRIQVQPKTLDHRAPHVKLVCVCLELKLHPR